ncbi:hypothetical protein [Pedobacter ginsengisoli]|uniref:hypothetical protein n=1 Tax=Pedobacter ginsengisoli TaxID=363852 RepID=UPI00254F8A78|nr:hypothetical protein [Pedobacter ginsengisoli]
MKKTLFSLAVIVLFSGGTPTKKHRSFVKEQSPGMRFLTSVDSLQSAAQQMKKATLTLEKLKP